MLKKRLEKVDYRIKDEKLEGSKDFKIEGEDFKIVEGKEYFKKCFRGKNDKL